MKLPHNPLVRKFYLGFCITGVLNRVLMHEILKMLLGSKNFLLMILTSLPMKNRTSLSSAYQGLRVKGSLRNIGS